MSKRLVGGKIGCKGKISSSWDSIGFLNRSIIAYFHLLIVVLPIIIICIQYDAVGIDIIIRIL